MSVCLRTEAQIHGISVPDAKTINTLTDTEIKREKQRERQAERERTMCFNSKS